MGKERKTVHLLQPFDHPSVPATPTQNVPLSSHRKANLLDHCPEHSKDWESSDRFKLVRSRRRHTQRISSIYSQWPLPVRQKITTPS